MNTDSRQSIVSAVLTDEIIKNKWNIVSVSLIGFFLGLGIAYMTSKGETLPTKELSFDKDIYNLISNTDDSEDTQTTGGNNK